MAKNITNRIIGTGYVESTPVVNHYHNGKVYKVVSLWAPRKFSKLNKKDYVRIYLSEESSEAYCGLFKVGNLITFEGSFIKSKITETLSDVAVILDHAEITDSEDTLGFRVEVIGEIVKLSESVEHNNMISQSFLVLVDTDLESRVILKFTAVDKMINVLHSLDIKQNSRVELKGSLLSYQVKNRSDITAYLHDTRVNSVKKLGDNIE